MLQKKPLLRFVGQWLQKYIFEIVSTRYNNVCVCCLFDGGEKKFCFGTIKT